MVIWTDPARDDLKQIHDHIAENSSYYAEEVIFTIIEKTELLTGFPHMGRVVPELDEKNVRELFVYSYRIIYEILPDKITINAVIHAKRDFNEAYVNP